MSRCFFMTTATKVHEYDCHLKSRRPYVRMISDNFGRSVVRSVLPSIHFFVFINRRFDLKKIALSISAKMFFVMFFLPVH